MEDELTLTPVYEFTWDDGSSRRTDDEDFSSAETVMPEAVEELARIGREDPSCEVEFVGMGN